MAAAVAALAMMPGRIVGRYSRRWEAKGIPALLQASGAAADQLVA